MKKEIVATAYEYSKKENRKKIYYLLKLRI